MYFKTLELSDKDEIFHLFRAWGYENAESSFANLFIWRKYMNLQFCVRDCTVYLLVERKCRKIAFMPISAPGCPVEPAIDVIMDYFRKNEWEFSAFCADFQRDKIEQSGAYPGFDFKEIPQSNEYIYDAESLRTLSGRLYQKKRNHINNFTKNNDGHFEYAELSPEHFDECMELYDTWLVSSGQDEYMEFERASVVDALNNFKYIGLKGAIVRVNGKLEAFTLGEHLSKDIALIHIEKANKNIIGLYPFINQTFLCDAFPDVRYVNREEDLGIEGLIKAKQSYYPVRYIRKYGVRLK